MPGSMGGGKGGRESFFLAWEGEDRSSSGRGEERLRWTKRPKYARDDMPECAGGRQRRPTFSLIPLLFNGLLVGMIVAEASEGLTLDDRRGVTEPGRSHRHLAQSKTRPDRR